MSAQYGFSCYACREGIDFSKAVWSSGDAHKLASDAGWCLGLEPSGQAHFACPYCAPALYNVTLIDGRPVHAAAAEGED